jgi:hypothetical protein
MIGICRFFVDGELVNEQKNLVTTAGSRKILQHFSGVRSGIAQSIAVGVGDTAAVVADTELEFEVERANVLLISPDFTEETVIFKGRLSRELEAVIEEAGLWSVPQVNNAEFGQLLFKFNDTEGWSGDGVNNATNTKVGSTSLRLNPALSTTDESVVEGDPDLGGVGLQLDFSGMAANQVFKLAAYIADANTANIKVMFRTDASNYYTLTVTTPATGYKVFELPKSGAAATGSPDWANITSVAVSVTAESGGATVVDLDGLRVERFDIVDPDSVLVTRMVLTTPQVKTSDQAMDIEYSLSIEVT